MQKRPLRKGRPTGSTTYDPVIATAFGRAVRMTRMEIGMAQEALASLAGIERSHMGKIERGEHLPTLALVFKIAGALDRSVSRLMEETEYQVSVSGNDQGAPSS